MPSCSRPLPRDVAIALSGVTKTFWIHNHRPRSLRAIVSAALGAAPPAAAPPPRAPGLFGIDLVIRRGEAVGIVGDNGSGKSSLVRVMAGIYPPTEGIVVRRVRVAPVLELGIGFDLDLSGRENLLLGAAIRGVRRGEAMAELPAMAAFAELADVLDTPLRYYSTGMRARLAFALATAFAPEALLLDEALAVGDRRFRERCLVRIAEHHGRGGTLVLVSHGLDDLRRLCPRSIWLRDGRIVQDGATDRVIAAYEGR